MKTLIHYYEILLNLCKKQVSNKVSLFTWFSCMVILHSALFVLIPYSSLCPHVQVVASEDFQKLNLGKQISLSRLVCPQIFERLGVRIRASTTTQQTRSLDVPWFHDTFNTFFFMFSVCLGPFCIYFCCSFLFISMKYVKRRMQRL